MAEFVECPNSLKPSLSFREIEQSLDAMSHFDELSGHVMDQNPHLGFMGYSNDNFLPFLESFSGLLPVECPKPAVNLSPAASAEEWRKEEKKRKAETVSEANSVSSSATLSETKKKNVVCTYMNFRGRSNSKETEKPKEVVHVRARRGQATDSHSLAERVRREKINDRMRCLQNLVPGCYKTMGMAGMLDEIINYVQSLQNQVEFLSMKLSAASSFYDFNLDMETATAAQVLPRVSDAYQAQEMERLMREGYGGGCTSFLSATMPL